MFDWSDWKWWVVILSLVIGTIISVLFIPQTKQDTAVIEDIKQSEVIVIFLPEKEWSKAEDMLWTYYDKKQYYLLEKFYDEMRSGWWVKIDKVKK